MAHEPGRVVTGVDVAVGGPRDHGIADGFCRGPRMQTPAGGKDFAGSEDPSCAGLLPPEPRGARVKQTDVEMPTPTTQNSGRVLLPLSLRIPHPQTSTAEGSGAPVRDLRKPDEGADVAPAAAAKMRPVRAVAGHLPEPPTENAAEAATAVAVCSLLPCAPNSALGVAEDARCRRRRRHRRCRSTVPSWVAVAAVGIPSSWACSREIGRLQRINPQTTKYTKRK